jgi:hypothetical protein
VRRDTWPRYHIEYEAKEIVEQLDDITSAQLACPVKTSSFRGLIRTCSGFNQKNFSETPEKPVHYPKNNATVTYLGIA